MSVAWPLLLVPALALALLLGYELACQLDDLWRDIEFGLLLAFLSPDDGPTLRRLNGWPYLSRRQRWFTLR